VPSLRTEVTEIVTGLAMLGVGDLDWALAERPGAMAGVDDVHWERLAAAREDPGHAADFASAWANGSAFLRATDGLRGRPPMRVEWKGPDKLPAVADVPADLRIDHVYLVSCKYLSKILRNSSPATLFDGCLGERPADTVADWYAIAAPGEYEDLWLAVREDLDDPALPTAVDQLGRTQRDALAVALRGKLSPLVDKAYRRFAHAVADRSAARWSAALPDVASRERLLWRMLRLTGAPYFVLGTSGRSSLRLRIDTPWDWRQRFKLKAFEVWGEPAGQPIVRWQAAVTDRETGGDRSVRGHVEVRWSHGRFRGAPEAKVYLDTKPTDVPGFWPLA
jgi:hypothetical protein